MTRTMFDFLALLVRNAAGEGGGAGGAPADPGSVLFPNDAKPADNPAGDDGKPDPAGDGDDPKPGDPPSDWKEYEPDPAKSDDENAAAKAEHDKTKPADKTDDKTDEEKAAEAAAALIPEDGKYQVTMPEGVALDEERMSALGPIMAKHKLTTGAVQEIIDAEVKLQQQRATAQEQSWAETVSGWITTAKADKEIGGDRWDDTVASAQRAMKKLGSSGLKDYLEASGGGNHPELIRFAAKVGAMIREDSPPKGGVEGGGKPVDTAHILFPNDAPKG